MARRLLWRSGKTSPPLSPREWSNKKVVAFLEQHDLHAYSRAARKAKLKGSHLLDVALGSASRPSTTTTPQTAELRVSHRRSCIERRSVNLQLLSPRSIRRASTSNEALVKLCQQLGVQTDVDRQRLWIALLMLAGSEDEQQPTKVPDSPIVPLRRPSRTYEDVILMSEPAATEAPLKRSSSFGSIEVTNDSGCFTPPASPIIASLPVSPAQSPQPSRLGILGGLFRSNRANLTLPRNAMQPKTRPRTSTEEEVVLRKPDVPLRLHQQDATFRHSRKRNETINPYLAYAETHGQLVIKCCLDVVDQHDRQIRLQQREKEYDETCEHKEISLIRLNAKKPLFEDLMREVHRLHGQLLSAMEHQHREIAEVKKKKEWMRIKYEDCEGDSIKVQDDHSLQYALTDWRRAAKRVSTRSFRLVVEVTCPPAPSCP